MAIFGPDSALSSCPNIIFLDSLGIFKDTYLRDSRAELLEDGLWALTGLEFHSGHIIYACELVT